MRIFRTLMNKSKNISGSIIMLAVLIIFSAVPAKSQTLWERADKAYDAGDYDQAIELYHQAVEKSRDIRTVRKLANSYLMVRNGNMASFWYQEVCQSEDSKADDFLNYGKALKLNEQYAQARKQGELYIESGGDPAIGEAFIASCEMSTGATKGPARYSVKKVNFNSTESEIGPQFYQGGLVFSSNRHNGHIIKYSDPGTGIPFFDLYYVDLRAGSDKAIPLQGSVNSRVNDAAVSFAKEETQIYFTRNHVIDGQTHTSGDGQNKLCILTSQFNGKKWQDTEVLHFNNMDFSCGHPSVSEDGNMLYFISDAPGGMGGTDLYVCFWEEDAWGQPQNLGTGINTPANELFPFIYNNEILFFSTEGHAGLGGLDIFHATYKDGEWSGVKNAGYPLNSSSDDFSVTVNETGTTGYFASNREGGMGQDDIYEFKTKARVIGIVRDQWTKDPVPNAEVLVVLDNNDSETVRTGSDGKYEMFLRYNTTAMLKARAENYKQATQKVSTRDVLVMKDIEINFEIERDNLYTIAGRIKDEVSGAALTGVTVKILGPGNDVEGQSGADGGYSQKIGYREGDYQVLYIKDGYIPQTRKFSTKGINGAKQFDHDIAMKEGKGLVIEGSVVQKGSGGSLAGVDVACIDAEKMTELHAGITDGNGRFFAILDQNKETYIATGSKNRYFAKRVDVPSLDSLSGSTWKVTIEMSPYLVGETVESIRFAYNKAKIDGDAGKDLYSLVYFLKDNPEATVELSAHTDSRGSLEYNLGLSQRRAKAVFDFIVARGIAAGRISYAGYGENRLVNDCKDGVPCNDAQHSENRRCELSVTGLSGK